MTSTATEAIDISNTHTTLLPVTTEPEATTTHQFAVDGILGVEVGRRLDLQIGQEVMVAVRCRITQVGTRERAGQPDRLVTTTRGELLSVEAIDEEPLPAPAPKALDIPVPTQRKGLDSGTWFLLAALFGCIAMVGMGLYPYI
jgi:hypothetical protein